MASLYCFQEQRFSLLQENCFLCKPEATWRKPIDNQLIVFFVIAHSFNLLPISAQICSVCAAVLQNFKELLGIGLGTKTGRATRYPDTKLSDIYEGSKTNVHDDRCSVHDVPVFRASCIFYWW